MGLREQIIGMLDGSEFQLPAEKLQWTGYLAVYKMYKEAPPPTQGRIAIAMSQIIDRANSSQDEKAWYVAADVIHLGYSLGITAKAFQRSIKEFDLRKAPSEQAKETIEYSTATYCKSTLS